MTQYVVDSTGHVVAEVPTCCPARRSESVGPACKLAIDHYRRRKTGPPHPLAVVVCRTHQRGFTLYPAGYAPYRRQPVLRLTPDGGTVDRAGDLDEFRGTVFEAAIDADAGQPWARRTEAEPPERWWRTQGRHLSFGARLVGITDDATDAARQVIAATLSIDTLTLRESAIARGYRAIGEAVCAVLRRLRGGSRRAMQLLLCGYSVGHWGEPREWDAARQVMVRPAFRIEVSPGRSAV